MPRCPGYTFPAQRGNVTLAAEGCGASGDASCKGGDRSDAVRLFTGLRMRTERGDADDGSAMCGEDGRDLRPAG